MLLHGGEPFDWNGRRLTYPTIRLVYWCGGNPFHHHQDLARLRRALARPDTIVVHDAFWTGMARHADVVLPATMTLERNDIGGSSHEPALIAMRRALEPLAAARERVRRVRRPRGRARRGRALHRGARRDGLAATPLRGVARPGRGRGRRGAAALRGISGSAGLVEAPGVDADLVPPRRVPRRSGAARRSAPPSGRIEIFSAEIDSFGYDDCPGHPAWMPPREWLGAPLAARYPLHLVANNPTARLHSQLDVGASASRRRCRAASRSACTRRRRRARHRGRRRRSRLQRPRTCLAGAVVTDACARASCSSRPGLVRSPRSRRPDAMCVHGNPNVLTFDRGTSKLAQACSGQHALVEVERWAGPLPPIRAYDPPAIERREPASPSPRLRLS
jgi:biotin/methionine sulfoxide reductase